MGGTIDSAISLGSIRGRPKAADFPEIGVLPRRIPFLVNTLCRIAKFPEEHASTMHFRSLLGSGRGQLRVVMMKACR